MTWTVHLIDGVGDGEVLSGHPDKPPVIMVVSRPAVGVDLGRGGHREFVITQSGEMIWAETYGLWVEQGADLYYRPEAALRVIASYADDPGPSHGKVHTPGTLPTPDETAPPPNVNPFLRHFIRNGWL